MDELLKCPFCGGYGGLYHDDYKGDYYAPWYMVECDKCHVSTDDYSTQQEAIGAWNNRI